MSEFVTHGLIGAGVMSAPVKLFRGPKWLRNVLAVYGFVMGGAPDTFDWIVAQFREPRWKLYTYFHRDADWWWLIQPPVFMHVKVTDPPFHLIPALDWWIYFGWLEIVWVEIAIALLWYSFRKDTI